MKIKKMNQSFYIPARDGVTQSLLSMFRSCRQKARLYLKGLDSVYHRLPLIYGTIGHAILQEAYSDIMNGKLKVVPDSRMVKVYARKVEAGWLKENPKPNKEALGFLEYSLAILEKTMPLYFDFWRKDLKQMKWLGLEQKFSQPYTLSDGRKTFVKGKMDGEFEKKGLWLFESKFKSQIQEGNLMDTLSYETQVMLYLWRLAKKSGRVPEGTLYNVVRRTALRERKGESISQFALRVMKDVEKRPKFYFIRFEIAIVKQDLDAFDSELSGMVRDFYDWWEGKVPHYKNTDECIGKYGRCQYMSICSRGDYSQFAKRNSVFKELEDF